MWLDLHSSLGFLSALMLGLHGLRTPRVRKVAAGVLVAAAVGWLLPSSGVPRGTSARTPMTTAERASGLSLRVGGGCGEAGCHDAIVAEWAGSAHRFATDNELYRAAVANFVAERGATEAVFCAACHDPERVWRGEVAEAYADGEPPPSDGVSCVACHGAVAALEARANGGFVYAELPEADATLGGRLDPRLHADAMFSDGFLTDGRRSCGPCHRLELGPDVGAAWSGHLQNPFEPGREEHELLCNDCHMPLKPHPAATGIGQRLARNSEPYYTHSMPGMNLDLPAYAVGEGAEVGAVEAFLAGRSSVEAYPPEAELQTELEQAMVQFLGAPSILGIEVERVGDELVVITRNLRAGHPFPIGPFDLHEVWQEVEVRVGGEVVWQVGQLIGDEVDPAAHRLGARELDGDGSPIQKHRIWTIAQVADKRLIPMGGAVEDRYTLPPGLGQIAVDVAWRFRRAPPAFQRWALGEVRLPAHTVASMRVVLP